MLWAYKYSAFYQKLKNFLLSFYNLIDKFPLLPFYSPKTVSKTGRVSDDTTRIVYFGAKKRPQKAAS